ncbi:MAG: 50S ribosomal protein L14 [Candidatus Harrisonbacteria bacterium]|nr:50S ribosomal protein L14 [Candidatus Harrisonbacteria bacterium]
MLQLRSLVKVADNTGAKIINVFRILGGSRKRYARLGEILIASVREAEPRKQVKKKDIVRCVVVRTANPIRRPDGSYLRFDENAVVIINEKNEPRGTRLFGPVPRELKEKYEKIFSLAEDIV